MKINLKTIIVTPVIVAAIVLLWAGYLSIAVENKLQADNGATQPGQLYVFDKPITFLSTRPFNPTVNAVGEKLQPNTFYAYQVAGTSGIPDDARAVTGVVRWVGLPSGTLLLYPARGDVNGSYSTLDTVTLKTPFTVLLGDGGKLGIWLTGHAGDVEVVVTGYYR